MQQYINCNFCNRPLEYNPHKICATIYCSCEDCDTEIYCYDHKIHLCDISRMFDDKYVNVALDYDLNETNIVIQSTETFEIFYCKTFKGILEFNPENIITKAKNILLML